MLRWQLSIRGHYCICFLHWSFIAWQTWSALFLNLIRIYWSDMVNRRTYLGIELNFNLKNRQWACQSLFWDFSFYNPILKKTRQIFALICSTHQKDTWLYNLLVILSFSGAFLWQVYQNNKYKNEKRGEQEGHLLNPCKLSLWRLFGWHNAKAVCTSLLSLVLQLCWHHSVITEMEQRIRLTLTQMAAFDSGEGHLAVLQKDVTEFNGISMSFT